MEATLASIGLLSPATVARANARLARFAALGGSTPAELLQVANVACWEWAAGTAAETVRPRAARAGAARAQAPTPRTRSRSTRRCGCSVTPTHTTSRSRCSTTRSPTRAPAVRVRHLDVVRPAGDRRAAARRRDPRRAGGARRHGLPGLSDFVRPPLFGVLALALVARGDLDGAEAGDRRERLRPGAAGVRVPEPGVPCARRAAARTGSLRGGARRLHRVGERSARIALRNPGDPWRLGAAACLLRLGCPAEAVALAEEQLELARRWGTPSALGIALHGHALAPAARPRRSPRPRRCSRASTARVDHARCLVDLGAALRRANQRARRASRCAKGWSWPAAAAPTRWPGARTTSS